MSFSTSGGNGGRPGMMSEINVTPMVDVMLVLLIIFMVAAPMMTQGLDVNLPKVDSTPLPTEDKQTVLTIKPDGTVLLDEDQVTTENLAYQVSAVMKANNSKMVFLRADQATAYGDVAAVMGQLRAAGITSIGLVTDPADKSAAPQGQAPIQPSAGASAPAPTAPAPVAAPTAPVRPATPGN
jgi:TolR protein